MTTKGNRQYKGWATHYAYLGGGDTPRKIIKVFNLEGVKKWRRRILIHKLIGIEGACLAILPDQFNMDCDLDKLESFLEGEL